MVVSPYNWFTAPMRYTIRGYALAHRMTIHQAFCKAYRERYDHTPDFKLIREDTDRYANFGAVPGYVTEFLKDREPQRISVLPYYAAL